MISVKNMRNLIFSDWTVLDLDPILKRYNDKKTTTAFWMCRCICGREKYVQGYALRSGTSKRCKNCSRRKEGSAFRRLLTVYKKNAEKRNLKFLLTEDQFFLLTQKNCFYCDLPPTNVYKSNRDISPDVFVYSGVDRKNNDLNYVLENCAPCCRQCNQAKMDYTEKEFIEHCKKIAERFP